MQNHYNLIYREEEREMMPTLKAFPPFPFGAAARSSILFFFPSTSASAPSRGPHSHAALSRALLEYAPSALKMTGAY
jgi:hypothetical protein